MLNRGEDRPVSFIPGRDMARPNWPCRLSLVAVTWLLLSSSAPIWVLCSSQQPVQRGGISPPGYGEPLKAQHHGETGQPQRSECISAMDWRRGTFVVMPRWENPPFCSPHTVQ